MRIVLVSAAWRRFDVTRLCLAQRAILRTELAERGHEMRAVIVADDENLEIARSFGFDTIERNNDYIGRKFNDGIEHALHELEADFVVLIGSDDWMHVSMFDVLPKEIADLPMPTAERPVVIGRPGPQAVTGKKIAFVDLEREMIQPCEARGRLGVIPWVFPASALRETPRPITETCNKGIDGSLFRGLKTRPEWIFHDPHPLARVDFKSNVNLNSYEKITSLMSVGNELPASETLRLLYDSELVDLMEEVASCVCSF